MRIKITEDQYAILNGHVDEAVDVEVEEISEPEEKAIFSDVHVDNAMVDRIKKLTRYFPAEVQKGKGLNGLTRKVQYLSNPGATAKQSMQEAVNALIVLNYLKKLQDKKLFEPSTSGFFFESFVAGLLGVQREDEKSGDAKGAADIIANDGKRYSLKLYKDSPHKAVQIKSKTQSEDEVTDYIILGVKKGDGIIDFTVLKTEGMTPTSEEFVKQAKSGKWYISQKDVISNTKSKSYILDYRKSKEQISVVAGELIERIKKMDKAMLNLRTSIDDMVKPNQDLKAIESAAAAAKDWGKELDKQQGEIEKSEELLKTTASAEKIVDKI